MNKDLIEVILLLNEVITTLEKEFKTRIMLGGAAKIILEELKNRLTKLQTARTLLLNQLEMTAGDEVLIIDEVEG
jgi:hypothetical protein